MRKDFTTVAAMPGTLPIGSLTLALVVALPTWGRRRTRGSGPSGAVSLNGRLSDAKEMARYNRMGNFVGVIRGRRPVPEPAQAEDRTDAIGRPQSAEPEPRGG